MSTDVEKEKLLSDGAMKTSDHRLNFQTLDKFSARRPAVNKTQRDARGVQGAGGDDEANTVKHPVGTDGQLRSVGVPVKDGEETDEERGEP